jgi:hypothetical protein
VPHQRARIDIPNRRNFVTIQIKLRGFRRAPVRRNLRKLADDQRFNVRARRFFVIEICANISNVRIREANDLPGVAWVGENFLVSGEAGVKNDFSAAARNRAGRAAVKYAPVFERENRRSVLNFVQRSLRLAAK